MTREEMGIIWALVVTALAYGVPAFLHWKARVLLEEERLFEKEE